MGPLTSMPSKVAHSLKTKFIQDQIIDLPDHRVQVMDGSVLASALH